MAGHKEFKALARRDNLRDHMSPIELALLSLGEATAIELHRDRDSQGFGDLKRDATDAGTTAGRARQGVEEFQEAVARYGGGKGTLKFPFNKPMPFDLIRRVVRFWATEQAAKAATKQK